MRAPARGRGVALVQALIVLAALAALAAAALRLAADSRDRLALAQAAAQAQAALDAGLMAARAELAPLIAAGREGWTAPREVPIGAGRVGWQAADLHGRFNLSRLADEGPVGAAARAAFARLAEEIGLPAGLTDRLLRALGPDEIARAAAFGSAAAPALPLAAPELLAAVPRPAEGGPATLAALWPLVAVLPAEAPWNPFAAPREVLDALVPGLTARDHARLAEARATGALPGPEALPDWAARHWPASAQAALAALPLGGSAEWIGIELRAGLDGVTLRRSVVLRLGTGADGAPELAVVLSQPIFE